MRLVLVFLFLFSGSAKAFGTDLVRSAHQLCGQGARAEKLKDFKQALHFYQAALALDPKNSAALVGSGDCQYALGDVDGAFSSYSAYLKGSPRGGVDPGPTEIRVASLVNALTLSRTAKTASAEDLREYRLNVVSLRANGGTVAMDGWNAEYGVDDPNNGMSYRTSGSHLIGGFTLEDRYYLWPHWSLGISLDLMRSTGTYDAYNNSSSVPGWNDDHEFGDFDLTAILAGPQLTTLVYRPGEHQRYSISLGVGVLALVDSYLDYQNYRVIWYPPSPPNYPVEKGTDELSGTGVGAKLGVLADWNWTKSYSVSAQAGYRIGGINTVYSSRQGVLTHAGRPVSLDYSGFFVELGVAYWR
jgi:tetratricopeptide (TPR) repeat protein